MRTNYVLIDFENLQPALLEALDLEHFRVMVFVGANQSRVSVEFASMLQRLGERARYVRISGSGRNALDFHIAFYAGELSAREPDAFIHIISGDNGFAPLLQHLKQRKVFARQYKDIGEIPHVKAANSKTLSAKVEFVKCSLAERSGGRPTKLKALDSTIAGMFPISVSEEVRADIIAALAKSGFLSVDGSKVTYSANASTD